MSNEVTLDDVISWLPKRSTETNKWSSALCVVGGSRGMFGSVDLCAYAAMRTGSGMVRVCVPSPEFRLVQAIEAVSIPMNGYQVKSVLVESQRCHALAIGPGLGQSDDAKDFLHQILTETDLPTVVDADGLNALGSVENARSILGGAVPSVLTPHEGEYERLTGQPVGDDREAACSELAATLNAIVLLKGPITMIANQGGEVLRSTTGDARLATAGTGDVLTGIIGSLLSQGVEPFHAAAAGAYIHGAAAKLGTERGFLAHDLPDLLPRWFEENGIA